MKLVVAINLNYSIASIALQLYANDTFDISIEQNMYYQEKGQQIIMHSEK